MLCSCLRSVINHVASASCSDPTLKQCETLQVKGEIAVTKRAAYAAEEAVQRLEREKQRQDFLIDGLQV